jgi:ubiquinone/menaquinone biosynthesis C-methylase UbiE
MPNLHTYWHHFTRILLTRIMRAFFYLLYHQFARLYDWVAWVVSLGKWTEWVATVIPEVEGPRVLELGHGTGHLQINLLNKGLWVFGVDESPQMGRLATKRLQQAGDRCHLMRGHAQSLPIPADSFDQVVATFPSEYIFDPESLSETYRILVPGGKMVVLPIAWITGRGLAERIAACLFRVTGQAPDWNSLMMAPFQNVGFSPQSKRVDGQSWSLMIILAEKPKEQNLPSFPKVS